MSQHLFTTSFPVIAAWDCWCMVTIVKRMPPRSMPSSMVHWWVVWFSYATQPRKSPSMILCNSISKPVQAHPSISELWLLDNSLVAVSLGVWDSLRMSEIFRVIAIDHICHISPLSDLYRFGLFGLRRLANAGPRDGRLGEGWRGMARDGEWPRALCAQNLRLWRFVTFRAVLCTSMHRCQVHLSLQEVCWTDLDELHAVACSFLVPPCTTPVIFVIGSIVCCMRNCASCAQEQNQGFQSRGVFFTRIL